MKYFLGVSGLVMLVVSFGSCVMAKTAIHEIGSLVILLVAVVLIAGGAIVEAIEALRVDIEVQAARFRNDARSTTLRTTADDADAEARMLAEARDRKHGRKPV